MKATRAILASLFGLIFILTGCGSFISDVRDEVNDELFDYDYDSSDSYAYDSAVSSLNNYSDLINETYDEMDYLEYDLFYYTDDISYYDPGVYEPTFTCLFELYSYDWLSEATASPSSEIAEADQTWLVNQANLIFARVDSTEEVCRELDRYVSAQDYKDDSFARSDELVNAIYAEIDAYYVLHNEMVDKLEALYDIHENFVVDPSNPISVGIGNMKIDMDYADELADILDDAYETESFARVDELQALYDTLLASADLNAPNPGITDEYVLDYYEYFYTDLQDNFLPASKRAIRAFNDGSWDDLDYAYWDVADYYGFLIDDYNTYLDVAGY